MQSKNGNYVLFRERSLTHAGQATFNCEIGDGINAFSVVVHFEDLIKLRSELDKIIETVEQREKAKESD